MFFSFFGGKCQLSSGEAIHEFKKGTTKKSSGGTNENENGKERCGLVSGVDDDSRYHYYTRLLLGTRWF